MTSEHPVRLATPKNKSTKRKKELDNRQCIIHYSRNTSDHDITTITQATFDKIRSSIVQRQKSNQHAREDEICNKCPDTLDTTIHGFHRWCYQSFTNVSNVGKREHKHEDAHEDKKKISKRRRLQEQYILFPIDSCIFCGNERRQIHGKREYLTKCVTQIAAKSISDAAERKHDENILREIRDQCLVAREAHYHNSCRRDYTRIYLHERSYLDDEFKADTEQNEAHQAAFKYICTHIETSIINGTNVERITMLRQRYLSHIQENNPQVYNAKYKTYKLKENLVRKFGDRIQFWRPNYRSELVYSNDIAVGQAVETAFEYAASDERIAEECALLLRRSIIEAKSCAADMPWPPTAQTLVNQTSNLPAILECFLSFLISGNAPSVASTRTSRLVQSYSQDMCFAVTNGRWKMAKHLLLGMTLRHMTGSADVLTLVNHFGHCQSYSQILELETAMCNSNIAKDTTLPEAISVENNIVTHLCWDNFDLNEETPSGAGTTHTAHGIVIQESVKADVTTHQQDGTAQKSKERSIIYKPKELEPCYLKKCEPNLDMGSNTVPQTMANELARKSDFFWTTCRQTKSEGHQSVPDWAGWVSCTTSTETNKQSTVEYMPPINAPMTDNATVQEVLKTSQKVAEEVGQRYTLVTFDLAVAKKAYAIMWQSPEIYKNTIVQLGAFHTICSYLGALGKRLKGCGFAEVIIESGVCASGSIGKVMSGKHYNRAIRIHKLTVEALERLLLEVFHRELADDLLDLKSTELLTNLAAKPTPDNLENVLSDENCLQLYRRYELFKKGVRLGHLGKTAQVWIYYMDKVWLALQFLRATKENNFDLHISCLHEMCILLFAYDHQNYARYIPVYLAAMMNLEKTHPGAEALLRSNGFSVSRSDIPASRNAVDITIEQTINRHAKSRGGIVGFSRNYSAYYRWCITRHTRASYVQAAYELADMSTSDSLTHKDTQSSKIAASERGVEKLIDSFSNFLNPFQIDNRDVLFCISSGTAATPEIERDMLKADDVGAEAFETFVKDRLVEKKVSLHSPLHRQNLKTFAALNTKTKLSSSQNKVVEEKAQRNLFGQLVMLATENNISLDKALAYQLAPVPWALATADGRPMKTDKSKLLHNLEKDIETCEKPKMYESVYIYDGNALLQAMTDIPDSFELLAERVLSALPSCERVDFVTDTYIDGSIKGMERDRRGISETFLIKGSKTKVPRDWKTFMSNCENKKQLVQLLLAEWSKDKYAHRLEGRRILFACENTCTCICSNDGVETSTFQIPELSASHEEADTKMMLHLLHAKKETSTDKTLIIRSPDTDVYILLLTYAQDIEHTVLFDTGFGNKRRLLNVKQTIEKEGTVIARSLLGLHCFTGCDTTSAFVRQGKIKPKNTLMKYPEFIPIFNNLGREVEVSDYLYTKLEVFVCCMYGKAAYTDINQLRVDLFRQKYHTKTCQPLSVGDGIDLSLLPPCRSSLKMHIRRANYQTHIWKTAAQQNPNVPDPAGHGWKYDEQHNLVYEWTEDPILPPEMVDILADRPSLVADEIVNDADDDIEIDSHLDIIFEDDSD